LFNTTNHRHENKAKIKLKHQNLTSQILPVCLPLKTDVFAVSIEKYRLLVVKTALDLNGIDYIYTLFLIPPSSITIYERHRSFLFCRALFFFNT
jgi:hypothetical protein